MAGFPNKFGFGTGSSTLPATGMFGSGATATTTQSTNLFGTTGFSLGGTTSSASSINVVKPTFSLGSFNTGTSSSTNTGLFANTTAATTSLSLFNKPAATSSSSFFGKLGTTTSTASAINQSTTQSSTANEFLVHQAVLTPLVFNDERDAIITKWNQLQAFWGVGKGYVNQAEAAEFKPDNPYCVFKAVGYSLMPQHQDEEGLVALITNKKLADLEANQQASVTFLHQLLGNQQSLSVCVDSVKALPDDLTEMIIYVQERLANGTVKRAPASLLYRALTQQNTQLQNAGVLQVVPRATLDKESLNTYLSNPPLGLDPLLWEQAKKDNPQPGKLIPVPMIGFTELHKRLKHQEQQTSAQQARLETIQNTLTKQQQDQATTSSRIQALRRKQLDMGHRVLRVVVAQEIHRKLGYGIQEDEEALRTRLEQIQQPLNNPTQYKSRLNELLSQIRLQSSGQSFTTSLPISSSPFLSSAGEEHLLNELKQHLKQQQDGLEQLISVIKDDMEDIKVMEAGYSDLVKA